MTRYLLITVLICGSVFYAYCQPNTGYKEAGENKSLSTSSSSQEVDQVTNSDVNNIATFNSLYEASRFLSQSTLGSDYEEIERTAQIGIEGWLEQEFDRPISMSYLDTTKMIWEWFWPQYVERWGYDVIVNASSAVYPIWFYFKMAWWHNTIHGKDLLRQRVSQSLSEIFVVSEKSNLELSGFGMADYYDLLYRNAFGNFRDLLKEVTMHPCMGVYLSHIKNPKSNPVNNTFPDENYAREIMQLFTIGLFELHPDGTKKRDSIGQFIPTYGNDDIKEFAKIFTGFGPAGYWWPWEDYSVYPAEWASNLNYSVATMNMWKPMKLFNNYHDASNKFLLNGQVVPSGQMPMQDIDDAIDNLFNHPNVGPFIGRLLIQRMVKSNPSPAYIKRVANVFNDNGEGVRGDLKAVIKSILIDEEARDYSWISETNAGKVRQPFLNYVQGMRAFNAYNTSDKMWNWGFQFEEGSGLSILNSPSVFNYYLPDYQPNGVIADLDLVAPEFQIHNSATSVNYINLMYNIFIAENYMEVSTVANDEFMDRPDYDKEQLDPNDFVYLDLDDETALVNDPAALVERLNIILAAGQLTENTKTQISNAIANIEGDDKFIVRSAIFLVMTSPDYGILK